MDEIASIFNSYSTKDGRILSIAALFDGDFSIDWIEQLVQERTSNILLTFEEAIKDGFLIKKDPCTFCFVNLSERQRFRDILPADEKQELHKRIADILLKELPDDNIKSQALSNHILYLKNDEGGCQLLVRAGDNFLSSFHIEQALRCYAKALNDLLNCSGEEPDRLFVETTIKYSKISTARHSPKEVISLLKKAVMRARKYSAKVPLALLEMHIAKNEWLLFHYPSALRHFENGWSLAKELKDPSLLRSAAIFRICFLYWHGRYREILNSYAEFVPEVENYPIGRFPLLALIIVGRCYAQNGQFTQGLGMLEAVRIHCQEKGDGYMAAQAEAAIGGVMLEVRHISDAIEHLTSSVEGSVREGNRWIHIWGALYLAYAYYLSENMEQAAAYLNEFTQYSEDVHVTMRDFPFFLELCLAIELNKLPRIQGISFEGELNKMIRSKNIFIRGIACRYKALFFQEQRMPNSKVLRLLNLSLKLLEESGHQIEAARSMIEITRLLLSSGEDRKAKETAVSAIKILSSYDMALIPDDFKPLIKDTQGENLLAEIRNIGKEVVAIRDNKDLFQYIIATVNRVAGAERGAIMFFDDSANPSQFSIRASKNLTSSQIYDLNFQSSMKLIEEVSVTGKGRILERSVLDDYRSNNAILSCMAVPLILRGKVVGVSYHDNSLIRNAFKESDLDLLSYFASLAAFALENDKAREKIQRLSQELEKEKLFYEVQGLQNVRFDNIVGESPAIRRIFAQVEQVAATDSTVLILGETGVGKELVARAIHRLSHRRDTTLIRVDCNALPESLITSELFGHEKGAFTGATSRHVGRFELADKGTIFLDEIGDLLPEVQIRLLRVLQTKEFERVGGSETHQSDFRLLVATNRDLQKEVNEQRFRADLYYRINVFPINVPPLRERKEDIPQLAYHFLKMYSKKMGRNVDKIGKAEMDKLIEYDWPGNVRELEHIIEKAVILSSDTHLHVPQLYISSTSPKAFSTLRENERVYILSALQKTGWKVRGSGGAAELLEINPSTLESRMKRLGIQK
jgi:transcriptional regulator with GAF, ATPase, and Fis domain